MTSIRANRRGPAPTGVSGRSAPRLRRFTSQVSGGTSGPERDLRRTPVHAAPSAVVNVCSQPIGPERCNISIPDILAITRVVLVPVIMVLARSQDRLDAALGWAAALFTVAAITDFLDGYLARRWHIESTLGAFLDTTADKLLVTGSLMALISIERVSIWAALIIVMREFIVMALRGLVALTGGLVKPSQLGKAKAVVQFVAIGFAFVRFSTRLGPMYFDEWLMVLAVVVTLASGWGYVQAFWETVRSESAGAPA